jgi:hypothetical protein
MSTNRPMLGTTVGDERNWECLVNRRPDEPMFVVLGRDPDGAHIVHEWADRREAAGGDPEHVAQARAVARAMRDYAADPKNAPRTAPDPTAYHTEERTP